MRNSICFNYYMFIFYMNKYKQSLLRHIFILWKFNDEVEMIGLFDVKDFEMKKSEELYLIIYEFIYVAHCWASC